MNIHKPVILNSKFLNDRAEELASGGRFSWDQITLIKYLGLQHIYDLEIENTHNFVGNDIVAHNTFISGNTGIGFSSPDRRLQIGSDINITPSNASLLTLGGTQFSLSGDSAAGTQKKLVLGLDTTDNFALIQTGNTSGVNYTLSLNPAGGNVGIGSSSANSTLSVIGNASIGGIYSGTSPPSDSLFVHGNVGIGNTTSANKLDVWGNGRITGTLTVDSNLTIGGSTISAPGAALTVASCTGCGASGLAQVGSMTTSPAFGDSGADGDWLGLGASAGRIQFEDLATDAIGFMSSNVGIGTTSPAYQLETIGSVGIGGSLTVSSVLRATQLVSCNTIDTDASGVFVCGSDAGAQYAEYSSAATWTKPTGAIMVIVEAIGAGGGGGGGDGDTAGNSRNGGSGGGGGAKVRAVFDAADLGSTETIGIGVSGAGGGGGNGGDGSAGGVGGNSTFGSTLTAYGGGGGQGGTGFAGAGGGGGGSGSAGGTGSSGTGGAGGEPTLISGITPDDNSGFGGAPGGTATAGVVSAYGGAGGGGGGNNGDGFAGGSSVFGCPAGGGAGDVSSGNVEAAGAAGGTSPSGSTGGGGAAGAVNGGAGTGGAAGSDGYCGQGGGGGGGQDSGTGGAGGAGGAPGGGGGGGGGGTSTGGAGGAGGMGEVRVWTVTGGAGADLAEIYYSLDFSLSAGDVVSADKNLQRIGFQKSASPYDGKILGIVTTQPGYVLGDDTKPGVKAKPIQLALAGRVPVKVSLENGPIEVGDYLTSSSTPGIAMKATRPGPTVGKALEEFSCNTPGVGPDSPGVDCQGKIMTFVNVSYADPGNFFASLSLDQDGYLIIPKIRIGKLLLDESAYDLTGKIASLEDRIKGLESRVKEADTEEATSSAQESTSSASLAEASSSALATNYQLPTTNSLALTPPDILLATPSATLANSATPGVGFDSPGVFLSDASIGGKLTAYKAEIQDNFTVFGTTTLGNTLIAGTLTIDGTLSIENGNTINALSTLYLQSSILAQGLDIFNGKVTIDKDGNIYAKTLALNQLRVNKDKSLGKGTIPAGQTQILIENPYVEQSSLIFTIPTLVISQKNKGEFMVKIQNPELFDIEFEYWIMGVNL